MPLEHDGKSADDELRLIACDGNKAVRADIPGDHGHMGGRIAGMLAFNRLDRIQLVDRIKIVKRYDAVRKIAAKGADIADRKDLGRNMYGQIAVIDVADMAARNQDLGAEAAQRN